MDLRPSGLNLRRAAFAILPLCLGAVALIYTLRSFDAASFERQAGALNWEWVGLAVLLDVAGYFAQGVRWSILLGPICAVGPLTATRAIYAGLFVNEVFPLRPGEVLRGLIIARESKTSARSIAGTMITERAMDFVWLLAAAVCTSLFVPLPSYVERALPYIVLGTGILGAILFAVGRTRWSESIKRIKNVPAFAFSLGILSAQGLAMWAAVKACNLPLSFPACLAVMVLVRLGTLLPGAPANLGTHQVSTVFALSLFGVTQIEATSSAFLIFAILTIPLWLVGLAAIAATGASWNDVSSAALEQPAKC